MTSQERNAIAVQLIKGGRYYLLLENRGEKEILHIYTRNILDTPSYVIMKDVYTVKNVFKTQNFIKALFKDNRNAMFMARDIEDYIENLGYKIIPKSQFKKEYLLFNIGKEAKFSNSTSDYFNCKPKNKTYINPN